MQVLAVSSPVALVISSLPETLVPPLKYPFSKTLRAYENPAQLVLIQQYTLNPGNRKNFTHCHDKGMSPTTVTLSACILPWPP